MEAQKWAALLLQSLHPAAVEQAWLVLSAAALPRLLVVPAHDHCIQAAPPAAALTVLLHLQVQVVDKVRDGLLLLVVLEVAAGQGKRVALLPV